MNKTRDIAAEAKKHFESFVMQEAPVRSYRFHGFREYKSYDKRRFTEKWEREPTGNLSYTLTWTPGQMVITGDIGELVLTHYHAMPTFEKALSWVAGSDIDYLLGKSDKHREYDAEATWKFFVDWLNEEPINALLGNRTWSGTPSRKGGYRDEARKFRKLPKDEQDENRESFERENPFFCERIEGWESTVREEGYNTPIDKVWLIYDCWNAWLKLWRHEVNYWHPESSEKIYDKTKHWRHSPRSVLTHQGRADLLDEARHQFQDQSSAADYLRSLGFDDYYGSESWNQHHIFQVAAMQRGARMILETLTPKKEVA